MMLGTAEDYAWISSLTHISMQRDDSWGRGKRSELVYRAFDGVLLISVTFDVLLPALQKLDHHRGNDKFDQLIVDAQFGLNQKIEV